MTQQQPCIHANAQPWIDISFDVKSNKPTPFGKIMHCPDCDAAFANDMPDADQIKQHYMLDQYYTQSNGSHMPDVKPALHDKVLTKLAWICDSPPTDLPDAIAQKCPAKGQYLDIGCGNGTLLTAMRNHGFDVSGIEPDPAARETATKAGIITHAGTAEDLPEHIRASQFDMISMTHVLEHCVAPHAALSNIRDILHNDGLFYCEVPNCGATYFKRHAQISEMLDVPRHLHFFTKKSLQNLCATTGLQITDWRYHGYTRHYNANWRHWENDIYQRLRENGDPVQSSRRSFASSLKLIAETARASPDRKYDCIGFFAKVG